MKTLAAATLILSSTAVTALAQSIFPIPPLGPIVGLADHGVPVACQSDASTSLNNAANDARTNNKTLYIPTGACILITAGNVDISGIRFFGSKTLINGGLGSVIQLKGTTTSPFLMGSSTKVDGLVFFWPDQNENNPAIAYEPLFRTASPSADIEITDNFFVNGYDIVRLGANTSPHITGRVRIQGNRGFVLRRFLDMQGGQPDFTEVAQNFISPGYFGTVAYWDGPLREFAAANGTFVHLATGSAHPSNDGLFLHDNFAFGIRYGVRLVSGGLGIARVENNTWDGVATVFSQEGGGAAFNLWQGNNIWSYWNGEPNEAPDTVSIFYNAEPILSDIIWRANNFNNCDGLCIHINSTNARTIQIVDNTFTYWGQTDSNPPEKVGISVNAPSVQGQINNNIFVSWSPGNDVVALSIVSGSNIKITDNMMWGFSGIGVRVVGGTVNLGQNEIRIGGTKYSIIGGTVTQGLTGTRTVRNGAGTGTCDLTFIDGVLVASTC